MTDLDPWLMTDEDVSRMYVSATEPTTPAPEQLQDSVAGSDEFNDADAGFGFVGPGAGRELPTFAAQDLGPEQSTPVPVSGFPVGSVPNAAGQGTPSEEAWTREPPMAAPPVVPDVAVHTAPVSTPSVAPVSSPPVVAPSVSRRSPAPAPAPRPAGTVSTARTSTPPPTSDTMTKDPEKGLQGALRRVGRRMEKSLPPEQLLMHLKKPLQRPSIVAVVNHGDGSGKTTMTAAMGQQMATHRRDRVIAVDAVAAVGGLSHRLPVNNSSTIQTMLDNIDSVRKWSDARQHTSQGRTGLELLASGTSIADESLLTADGYRKVISALTANDSYNLILVDSAAGVCGPLADAVLDSADVIVVPMSGMDGVTGGVATMNRLMYLADKYPSRRTHFLNLISTAVVVINHVSARSIMKDQEVAATFRDRIGVREVVSVPHDRALTDGAAFDITTMSKATSHAFLQLSAEIITSLRRGAA
ncbi:MinD/ParA family protein [Gordonia phosphorivorans]|uniref:MinD/ParA family protein n=1 Tax=Gordonia phosphorivorans TaxID=1056982 RepID=A0ABV6H4K1_9ACTN